jgi:sulfur carrier protein
MKISLNGENTETTARTVAELLEQLQVSSIGVAVAVNQSVVRRADHASHSLQENDAVEVIRAVQGG